MQIIVAADKHWAIGKDGDLLWHLPEDMRFFREKTTGNVVVMGRKTLDSFPGGKPLKNRVNLVLSRDEGFSREGAEIVHSMEEAIEYLNRYEPDQIFVIGGGHIYREFLPYCDTAYVTRVEETFEADTTFLDLDESPEWTLTEEGEEKEHNGLSYRFTTYKKAQ